MSEAPAELSAPSSADNERIVHRIGGCSIENLRLKEKEKNLDPPGFSVIAAPSPDLAALEIRRAFPRATRLHDELKLIASATPGAIRHAGFDAIPKPSNALPSHWRLVHPLGLAGFDDKNLAKLSAAFTETSDHERTQNPVDR